MSNNYNKSERSRKLNDDSITRKEALKRMGKYAALTAAGTFLILNPMQSQAASPPNPDGDVFSN